MRYSYEFKMMCIEMYRNSQWPTTPEGVSEGRFRHHIRDWNRMLIAQGPESLMHKRHNKVWSTDEKIELITRVLSGEPRTSVALESGINPGTLYQWIQKYKTEGYNGLVIKKRGRPGKAKFMRKKTNPAPLTESEREELIRLRTENEYIKAENEVIKKQIALRHENWAAQLKAKKQQSLKNFEKKDTN